MNISQYSDEELLEEVKHRGFKIEIRDIYLGSSDINNVRYIAGKIKIGGVLFDITR